MRRRNRWRRIAGVTGAGLLLLALLVVVFREALAGSVGLPGAPEPDLEAAVHERFEAAGADDEVVLAEVTDVTWDAVGVFGPYYPHESVVEDMGVRVPRVATNNLQYDERCLLVFRRDGRVVAWTVVSRAVAECAGDASGHLYSPEEARFRGDLLAPTTAP